MPPPEPALPTEPLDPPEPALPTEPLDPPEPALLTEPLEPPNPMALPPDVPPPHASINKPANIAPGIFMHEAYASRPDLATRLAALPSSAMSLPPNH